MFLFFFFSPGWLDSSVFISCACQVPVARPGSGHVLLRAGAGPAGPRQQGQDGRAQGATTAAAAQPAAGAVL